ncbi:FAD-binding oxidoreductase [Flavobacteriaceae bacterium M23B6Z8]
MEHKIILKNIEFVTHNVLRLVTEKPENYSFNPGQATELSIDKDGWRDEKRPFTFTSLPEDSTLEFTIKIYPSHNGMTEQLPKLKVGDHLILGDSWGAISYKGPGTFIAGGAGITPFIAIMKDLKKRGLLDGNTLFFGNDTEKDIIYKENLNAWLRDQVHHVLSKEDIQAYDSGFINKELLKKYNLDTSKYVYLCGPPPMMESVQADLHAMGVSKDMMVAEDLT